MLTDAKSQITTNDSYVNTGNVLPRKKEKKLKHDN